MLRESKGSRAYNERITLTRSAIVVDDYGHKSVGEVVDVLDVYARVRQMSATKTSLTFQVADVIGLEIEFRYVDVPFNGIRWQGHAINFSAPEVVDNRGRILRVTGYYQQDNP